MNRLTWRTSPLVAVTMSLCVLALLGPWIAPHDPLQVGADIATLSEAPSWRHWLGTDPLGRDIMSRMLAGSRTTLGVAFGAVTMALVVGTAVGAASAVLPALFSRTLTRLTDVLRAVPRVVLLVGLTGLLPPAQHPLQLAALFGLTAWTPLARLVLDLVRLEQRQEHVQAARALGASTWRITRAHLAPAVAPQVAIWAGALFAECILLEAGLSFLGLGVPVPTPSWGTVLRDVGDVFGQARWLMIGPGLWIALVVAAVQSATDGPVSADSSGAARL
jgi:ABC-type dipeptide/oligopeptide/nickel transport system permease subunit